MSDGYELRAVSFMAIRFGRPAVHTSPELDAVFRDLRHLFAYSPDGLDCELRAWEDRANREDCWRDWWKTGRDWIRPEGDDS